MITSPGEGEGKTTTAAGLAMAEARAGSRVVLVDLDRHRSGIARQLGLEGGPGLAAVAAGAVSLDDALREVPLGDGTAARGGAGSLHVLPADPGAEDPADLLESEAVVRVLDAVRARSDLVVLDVPPVLALGDALALTERVDAVLLVARVGRTRREHVQEAADLLAACPAALLGVAATGVPRRGLRAYG
jgi:non-specific protein-tyrosine kinase